MENHSSRNRKQNSEMSKIGSEAGKKKFYNIERQVDARPEPEVPRRGMENRKRKKRVSGLRRRDPSGRKENSVFGDGQIREAAAPPPPDSARR